MMTNVSNQETSMPNDLIFYNITTKLRATLFRMSTDFWLRIQLASGVRYDSRKTLLGNFGVKKFRKTDLLRLHMKTRNSKKVFRSVDQLDWMSWNYKP